MRDEEEDSLDTSYQSHIISLERLADVPRAEDIVLLAQKYHRLTVRVATRLRSHAADSEDIPTVFFNDFQEEVRALLPDDCSVRTGSQLRRYLTKERSDDGALASWSYITICHTWTEKQALSFVPVVAAAAREYDALATRLMIRLAYELDDLPEYFAGDDGHWCQYDQTGRMGDWHYFFHGVHCSFGNKKTNQYVEAAQGSDNAAGYGFGDLEPGFFARFCQSTPAYADLVHVDKGNWQGWSNLFEVAAAHGYLRKVPYSHGSGTGFFAVSA